MKRSILLSILLATCTNLLMAQKLEVKETRRLEFEFGITKSLAISPDEKYLACGGELGELVVYDITTKTKILQLQTGSAPVDQCAWLSEPSRLVTLGDELILWSFPQGVALKRSPSSVRETALAATLAISRDGKSLAHLDGHKVHIRDSVTGGLQATTEIKSKTLGALQFSPDGETLHLGVDHLGVERLWHWKLVDSVIQDLPRRVRGPWPAAFCWLGTDTHRLVANSNYELIRGEDYYQAPAPIRVLQSTPDGATISVLTRDFEVILLDRDLHVSRRLETGMRSFNALAMGQSGRLLAFCGEHDLVTIWREKERSKSNKDKLTAHDPESKLDGSRSTLAGNTSQPKSIAFDPDGRTLAVCSGGRVWTIDPDRGTRKDRGLGNAVARGWLPGEILVADKDKGEVYRLAAKTAKRTFFCKIPPDKYRDRETGIALLPSPRSGQLLFCWNGTQFGTQSLLKGKLRDPWLGMMTKLLDATWSPDGEKLLLVRGNSGMFNSVVLRPINTDKAWRKGAEKAAALLRHVVTGDWSPRRATIVWGGRHGVVTYHRTKEGKDEVRLDTQAHVRWLRHLDADHFLSHDGQVLTLWEVHVPRRLAHANPLGIPKNQLRAKHENDPKANKACNSAQIRHFIHKAILSPDNKRLALIGNRDLRVYDLDYR